MNVFELRDPGSLRLRTHPWTESETQAGARYWNLRAHPEQIRSHLEDLVPFADQSAIEEFFQILEWLNGPSSPLESNDCAFTGVVPNSGTMVEAELEASGRLMVLFRDLRKNLQIDAVGELTQTLAMALHELDPGMTAGAVGVSIVPVRYLQLQGDGHQLMLSFWAWGNTETETWDNLHRTLSNLRTALQSLTGGG